MLGDTGAFLDVGALIIVLAGTFLATAARCGWRDLIVSAKTLSQLWGSDFDADANRVSLARSIPEIRRRGHLCADAKMPPDFAFSKLVKAYLIGGSIDDLHQAARSQRAEREISRARATRVFEYAGELAPIFGLVGTLYAITQINPAGDASTTQTMMGAVGTAVLSSLYGVLTAHLFCIPLASAIERRGMREENARAHLVEWFSAELIGRRAVEKHRDKDGRIGPKPVQGVPIKDAA